MSKIDRIDPLIFKIIHLAYDKVLMDQNKKNTIFYHIHNPDTFSQLNLSRLDSNVKWLRIVREPIQNLESHLKNDLNSYKKIALGIGLYFLS